MRRTQLAITIACSVVSLLAQAQRTYKSHSVLSNASVYRFYVTQAGIYSLDIPFLNKLGVNTSNLSSGSVQLFGNGGRMLSESNAGDWTDDLQENAIEVQDGGDAQLNGPDRILFYANGPDSWLKDSADKSFIHQKNRYTDRSTYFLVIGQNGLRIPSGPSLTPAGAVIDSYSGRAFHELDTVNFLSSGREWYGEEFSDLPGRSLSRKFQLSMPDIVPGAPMRLRSQCIARSVGSGSRFEVTINNSAAGSLRVVPVGTGQYDAFAQTGNATGSAPATTPDIHVGYTYFPGSANAQGWLNWSELFTRQRLQIPLSGQLLFRDWESVGAGGQFVVSTGTLPAAVWDVTDPLHPVRISATHTGNELRFAADPARLHEYAAFQEGSYLVPIAGERVPVQDLHAITPVQHIIITHPDLLGQAQRLVQVHDRLGLGSTKLVTTQQVFNEFASGNPDPVAIRDFVKMYFDSFADSINRPRSLLLFGDASFDYKDRIANNTNLMPCYQSPVSLDILASYTTDDFFGFLGDQEDINAAGSPPTLDIGIGRVPAKNIVEAKNFVDKVEAYYAPPSLGPWRNQISFVADDEDQNLHLQDAETVSGTVNTIAPVFEKQKLYLDAYPQVSAPGGSRYPQVNQAVNNQIAAGTLIWNFAGHGGARRLAEEDILDQEMVNTWSNEYRLPLFITATCDFAPYDNPLLPSLGENLLLRPKSGAIALMTTTRVVFAFSNRVMNENYLQVALQPRADGSYRTLGDAVRDAKNLTYRNFSDITNNRKFTLLGDPSLTLGFPRLQVAAVRINGRPVSQVDTLSAGEKITIEGEVRDVQGNIENGFNGQVYPVVMDKPQSVTTLGNDPDSPPVSFLLQNNLLFKGKSTVRAGKFSFSFKVPRDINYLPGKGRLSLYADDGSKDGNGVFSGFLVGGTAPGADNDHEGPVIRSFLNDEKFINGGISNQAPILLLRLSDSSGINTAGTGIGHDILATLDNDDQRYFVLNEFFQGALDSYQEGTVSFQLPQLEPGAHTLRIKAWDVLNNSSEAILDFVVASDESLQLTHVLNYPNPFSTRTAFWFEHNKPGQNLLVRLQIFTVAGRVIKSFERTINTPGNRSNELEWDGRDEFGDRVGKGVYLYRLTVTAPGKQRKEKIEKLVLF